MKKTINFMVLLLVSLGLINLVSAHEGPGELHGIHVFDWVLGVIVLLILVIIILLFRRRANLSKSSRKT